MADEQDQQIGVRPLEKEMEKKFDAHLDKLTKRAGFDSSTLNWLDALEKILFVQLGLCCLTMFARPSFLTLTVCTIGLYMTAYPNNIRFKQFRLLMFFTLLSWVYDAIWLLLINSKADEDEQDGGVESTVRGFALLFAYISLAFKVIVFAVIWKVSVNFRTIVRGRRSSKIGSEDLEGI